mgnify:CR=1 FL=1
MEIIMPELNIGKAIKRLRHEKDITQEELANALGVTNQAVSKWESKNTYPDITMLFPLAEIFGVVPLNATQWMIVAGLSLAPLITGETGKMFFAGKKKISSP